MKRKLVKQGKNALTVTLPSKWAQKHSLEAGDEVEVNEKDDNILISSSKCGELLSKISADVSDMDDYIIELFLTNCHKKGYDEVRMKYGGPRQLDKIRERMSHLLGYEIVEHDDKYCLVKNVSGDMDKEYEALQRRSFLVTKNLFENIIEACKNKDFENLNSILALEATNNRLTNYCERILVKHMYKGKSSYVAYVIIWNLESIADDLRDLLKKIKENKKIPDFSAKFLGSLDQTSDLFSDYYDAFYQFSIDKINNLKTQAVELKSQLLDNMQQESKLSHFYFYLVLSVSRIYDMIASTISLNMDKFVKEGY